MRRRGDRVKITSGEHAGHTGAVESNAYQRTAEYFNGHQIMFDVDVFVTVRVEVEFIKPEDAAALQGGAIPC